MKRFLHTLSVQRWDDHRYYHHSRINQSLHLASALGFLYSYWVLFRDPALAALVAWGWSMTTRQAGHFFFEPRGYDEINHATHEFKEEIKVGYNLQRKRVLMAIWALSPLLLIADPTLFGVFDAPKNAGEALRLIGYIWFIVGSAGFLFRIGQLTLQQDAMTAVVWMTKILTDPFHDIQLYHKAPFYLFHKPAPQHVAAEAEDDGEPEIDDEPAPVH